MEEEMCVCGHPEVAHIYKCEDVLCDCKEFRKMEEDEDEEARSGEIQR